MLMIMVILTVILTVMSIRLGIREMLTIGFLVLITF